MSNEPSRDLVPAPPGFRVRRDVAVGRHRILYVFPGLDRLGPAERIERDAARRGRLFAETSVEVVDQDLWMYVSPHEMPTRPRRRGWVPVVSPGTDCIVVGQGHLRDSPEMILYLDIYHELCHILQRQAGANLWEPGVAYVDRKTEIDAYRFVVTEAKVLGVHDSYLREYLKVEWTSDKEHEQLLEAVGVAPPPPPPPARRSTRR